MLRGLLVLVWATVALVSSAAAAEVPNPAVEGPIEGGTMGRPFNSALEELRGPGYDYTEREFFFGGTATNLSTGLAAPYRSRMVVRLPRDPEAFSGHVYVEWANVTSNYDLESRWPSAGGEFHMRRGDGAVVVSAQLVGHTSLKTWDLERYASLLHPGDEFSYDIFAQAIEALRDPAGNGAPGADPMGGLVARKVVGAGTSQSAIRLTTFINDGYDRGGIDLFALTRGGGPYHDFSTPIVNVNEENNQIPQPDNPAFVGWEEAGSAHAPQRFMDYAFALADRDLALQPPLGLVAELCDPINRGTVQYTTRSMTRWIGRYLETGRMPPSAPRVERTAGGAIARDEHGLARGGVRHPFVAVPVAFNTGEGCPLFGKHEPWPDEKVRALYATRCDYVTKVRAHADREVEQGWLLPADREDAVRAAVAVEGPWPGETLDDCAAARPPVPLAARLAKRHGGRVLLVRGTAPAATRLTVRLLRGGDVVRRKRVRANAEGHYRTRFRIRGPGRYRAVVVARGPSAGAPVRSKRVRVP